MDGSACYARSGRVPFTREEALDLTILSVNHEKSLGDASPATCGVPNQIITPRDRQNQIAYVPGRPDIPLDPDKLDSFLCKELDTPKLDALYPHLWLVARNGDDNVDALHRQLVKGRRILVAEDMKMHLVWTEEKIHVKPVPECLFNFYFWELFLTTKVPGARLPSTASKVDAFDRRTALGFLRSYAFLVQHRSDFSLAKEHYLLPDSISWEAWCLFIANFRHLQDSEVAPRYHYGQMRLSRLNWATRICRPPGEWSWWCYELPYWSTGPYVENAALILAFIFASLSLVLSAMQVMLAVPQVDPDNESYNPDGVPGRVFWGFSIAVILASSIALVLLVVLPALYTSKQLVWGLVNRRGGVPDALT